MGGAGRPDHWTTVMGMGRASVSAVQNKSEGPSRNTQKFHLLKYVKKKDFLNK